MLNDYGPAGPKGLRESSNCKICALPCDLVFGPSLSPAELFRIGGLLSPLRSEGVVILGSGGIVHNLGRLDWRHRDGPAEQWALDFDRWFASKLEAGDIDALFGYQRTAPSAALAVPTNEHFHPLFVVLGAAREQGRIERIYEGFQYGTLSMRSFAAA